MPQKIKATLSFPQVSSKNTSKNEAKASRRKTRSKTSSVVIPHASSVGSAFSGNRILRLPGMSNLPPITFNYRCGTIQHYSFGTSTGAGAANNYNSFFVTNSGTYFAASYVPILPGDNDVGQSYIQDVMKHFARRVIHKLFIVAEPLSSSTTTNSLGTGVTTSNGLHYLAPMRGGNIDPTVITPVSSSTVIANSIPQTSTADSIDGSVPFGTWERGYLDLTPYIAGGSGPKQNEFANYNSAAIGTVTGTSNQLASPASFMVAGYNPYDSNALSGDSRVTTHNLKVVIVASLLDYIGGMSSYMGSVNNPALKVDTPSFNLDKNSIAVVTEEPSNGYIRVSEKDFPSSSSSSSSSSVLPSIPSPFLRRG